MIKLTAQYGEIKPLFRLAEEAFRLKCFTDLIDTGYFPNLKEVTESMAAFKALRRRRWRNQFEPKDASIRAIVIGDGVSPRTGALLAYMSRWQVDSVDPIMKPAYVQATHVKNLKPHREKIESFLVREKGRILQENRPTIFLAVHSHARLEVLEDLYAGLTKAIVVALPCCVRQNMPMAGGPVEKYRDTGVWSPQNQVKIWGRVRSQDRAHD